MTFKRILIGLMVVILLIAGAGWLFKDRIIETLFTRFAQSVVNSSFYDELPDGLHVFFCGTGSPVPDPARTGTCNGVIAGERVFIVDIAAGGLRNLLLNQFPITDIERVYLTHLHLDHIVGLGDLMVQYWMDGGHTSPLQVSGPDGVEVMVDGFNLAYSPDRQYRLDHQPDTLDPNGYGFEATTITLAGKSAVILEEEDLKITVFEVNHFPVEPAFGFRFDYKDRSVVFSGDTVYDENLIKNSEGTDLLIHEAMSPGMMVLLANVMGDSHGHTHDTLNDASNLHTTTVEAAMVAQTAGARELVLNHLVPAVPFRFLNGLFLGDAAENFDGRITVAEDGMIVSLPAQSDEIIHQ